MTDISDTELQKMRELCDVDDDDHVAFASRSFLPILIEAYTELKEENEKMLNALNETPRLHNLLVRENEKLEKEAWELNDEIVELDKQLTACQRERDRYREALAKIDARCLNPNGYYSIESDIQAVARAALNEAGKSESEK